MFFRLLLCDLRTRIRMFLVFAEAAVLAGAGFGTILGPAAAMPFLVSFVAWCYCGRTAGDDDKADMWPFLGALPIPPRAERWAEPPFAAIYAPQHPWSGAKGLTYMLRASRAL